MVFPFSGPFGFFISHGEIRTQVALWEGFHHVCKWSGVPWLEKPHCVH